MRLEGNSDLGPGIGKLRRSCCTVVTIPTIGSSFVVLLLLLVCCYGLFVGDNRARARAGAARWSV